MEQDGPAKAIGSRVREVRTKRGWSGADLARHLQAAGIPWERAMVAKLETGRRKSVTVMELLGLAYVLNVAPVHLLVPPDDPDEPYEVTPKITEPRFRVRGWIRGLFPLQRLPKVGDNRQFFAEVPADEFDAVQHGQCPVCGGRPPRQLTGEAGS
jgi:transcriptional regulator with XRE-family HTH domain